MGGNYSRVPETVCDAKDPGRKKFTMQTDEGTVSLTVPNYLEDKQVRWLVDKGKNVVDAYTNAGIWQILPERGMRPCIYDALRIKYYDPESGERQLTGGNFTCHEFHKCFENYLTTFRQYPEKRGRITIAPGVVIPSPDEEKCIRSRFIVSKNLPKSYHECGAADILPKWEGALDAISETLTKYPQVELYHIIRTIYYLQTQAGDKHHPAVHDHAPNDEDKKPWKLWLAAGVILLLLVVKDE